MDSQQKPKVFVPALIFGAVLGLALVVLTLVYYFLELSFKSWVPVVTVVVFIGIMVYALMAYKKEQGKGFVTYWRLVLMSFLITLVSLAITVPFNLALYSFDKEFFEQTKYEGENRINTQMDKQLAKYEDNPNFGTIESKVEEQRTQQIDKLVNATPFRLARQGFGFFVFFGVVVGLIASAFIRKNPDPLANTES